MENNTGYLLARILFVGKFVKSSPVPEDHRPWPKQAWRSQFCIEDDYWLWRVEHTRLAIVIVIVIVNRIVHVSNRRRRRHDSRDVPADPRRRLFSKATLATSYTGAASHRRSPIEDWRAPVSSHPSWNTTRGHDNWDWGHMAHVRRRGGPPAPSVGRLAR